MSICISAVLNLDIKCISQGHGIYTHPSESTFTKRWQLYFNIVHDCMIDRVTPVQPPNGCLPPAECSI